MRWNQRSLARCSLCAARLRCVTLRCDLYKFKHWRRFEGRYRVDVYGCLSASQSVANFSAGLYVRLSLLSVAGTAQ